MLRKTVGTVGTLATEAVSTAVNVAKHPIGTASLAVGFAKGLAGSGLDLVRGGHAEDAPDGADAPAATHTDTLSVVPEQTPAEKLAATPAEAPEDPRDELPGPDLAVFEPPRPEDLPEPIVIEADDRPFSGNGESGEAFHHEPKVADRDVEHGDGGTDFEEAEGFVDEIPEGLRPE